MVDYNAGKPKKEGTETKPFSQIHDNLLYDILNNTYQDALLQPKTKMDERNAMIQMAERLDHSNPSIVIANRGYEGSNTIAHLLSIENCNFIIRTRTTKGAAVNEIADLPDEEIDKKIEFKITTSSTFYHRHKDTIPNLKLINKAKKHLQRRTFKE